MNILGTHYQWTKVCFENAPFYVSEIRKMHCQFGSHYYKDKSTGKRTCLQGHGKEVVLLTLKSM